VPFFGSFFGHAKNERPAASIKSLRKEKTKLKTIQYFYAPTLTHFNREIDRFLRAIRTGANAYLPSLTLPLFTPLYRRQNSNPNYKFFSIFM